MYITGKLCANLVHILYEVQKVSEIGTYLVHCSFSHAHLVQFLQTQNILKISDFSVQYKIGIPVVYRYVKWYSFGISRVHNWHTDFDQISVRATSCLYGHEIYR